MKIEILPLSEIHENEANPRTITKERFSKLVDNILLFPAMLNIRPIVVDDSLTILGWNMRYRALVHISQMDSAELKKRLIKSKKGKLNDKISAWAPFFDKPTVPIIKASVLTDDEKRRFIIEDNVAFGEWDWDKLANEWDGEDLEEWGLDVWQPEGEKGDGEGEKYTAKIESPQYEPRGEKPNLSDAYDLMRYNELISEIDASDVPEDEKVFLRFAATRHITFNYEMLADYYAHAEKETQKLFESSVLVIIDFNDAIQKGFVKINEGLIKQQEEDFGDDAE